MNTSYSVQVQFWTCAWNVLCQQLQSRIWCQIIAPTFMKSAPGISLEHDKAARLLVWWFLNNFQPWEGYFAFHTLLRKRPLTIPAARVFRERMMFVWPQSRHGAPALWFLDRVFQELALSALVSLESMNASINMPGYHTWVELSRLTTEVSSTCHEKGIHCPDLDCWIV